MYATVTQLRTYLSQVPVNADTTALLTDCLNRATDLVRTTVQALLPDPAFDVGVVAVPATQIVTGYPTLVLALPPHISGSVTLVEREAGNAWQVVTGWAVSGSGLYLGSGWTFGRYRVTATWGYGAVPPILEQITLEVAVNIWRSKDTGGYGESVGVEGSGAVSVISGLSKTQYGALARYAQTLWRPSL